MPIDRLRVNDADVGPQGHLIGHMARANPQWRDLRGEVMAIFSGPHAYVSPSWYEEEGTVPTWNYIAVHAYGTVRLVEEPEDLSRILSATVAAYEGSMLRPWTLDTGTVYFQRMMRAVVGFRITIDRLEGKWKLSQNHPPERRQKVIRALEQSDGQDANEVARLMREMLG